MEHLTPGYSVHLGQVRSALEEVGVPDEQIETALQRLEPDVQESLTASDPSLVERAREAGERVRLRMEESASNASSHDPRDGAPQIGRDAFVEHGIEPSDAEVATLNELLKAYTELALTGGGSTNITIPEGPVDMERVYLLVDFAISSGILSAEDVAILRDGVRAKLVAGGSWWKQHAKSTS